MMMMTLIQLPATKITRPYVLQANEDCIFITFNTAQEAFDWATFHCPSTPINVHIQPKLVTITNNASQSR